MRKEGLFHDLRSRDCSALGAAHDRTKDQTVTIQDPRHRFLIDCDPGHDDALAILYANARLNLVGITTIFGNQSVEKTTDNALRVCTLSGISVPVAAGAAGPLAGSAFDGADVHGETGLDGAELPAPDRQSADRDAADFIIDASRNWPGALILIATGPADQHRHGPSTGPGLAVSPRPGSRSWAAPLASAV